MADICVKTGNLIIIKKQISSVKYVRRYVVSSKYFHLGGGKDCTQVLCPKALYQNNKRKLTQQQKWTVNIKNIVKMWRYVLNITIFPNDAIEFCDISL